VIPTIVLYVMALWQQGITKACVPGTSRIDGGSVVAFCGDHGDWNLYLIQCDVELSSCRAVPVNGSGTAIGLYIAPPPFDVPPTEWDADEPDGTMQPIPCDPPLSGNSGVYCAKPSTWKVHHSACVKPGTHDADPSRFPLQDATGVWHCLALGR
jgi:hypothetical protein